MLDLDCKLESELAIDSALMLELALDSGCM